MKLFNLTSRPKKHNLMKNGANFWHQNKSRNKNKSSGWKKKLLQKKERKRKDDQLIHIIINYGQKNKISILDRSTPRTIFPVHQQDGSRHQPSFRPPRHQNCTTPIQMGQPNQTHLPRIEVPKFSFL